MFSRKDYLKKGKIVILELNFKQDKRYNLSKDKTKLFS